jgi:hypothetical protein
MAKLSNVQFSRFCGLISVSTGKTPNELIKDSLSGDGFIEQKEDAFFLTEKGSSELARLATIAGLVSDETFDSVREKEKSPSKVFHMNISKKNQPYQQNKIQSQPYSSTNDTFSYQTTSKNSVK